MYIAILLIINYYTLRAENLFSKYLCRSQFSVVYIRSEKPTETKNPSELRGNSRLDISFASGFTYYKEPNLEPQRLCASGRIRFVLFKALHNVTPWAKNVYFSKLLNFYLCILSLRGVCSESYYSLEVVGLEKQKN